MQMTPIDPEKSSNLKAWGYDSKTKVMRVQFKNGGMYDYADVPQEKVDEFKESDSMGSYLNVAIKSEHDFTKVP